MRLHDEIRRIGENEFVVPARDGGKAEFPIAVRDLITKAGSAGISTVGRVPAFCNAIQTREFLDAHGLEVVRVEGPKSKLSTTVVVHYRFRNPTESIAGPIRRDPPADPLMRLRGVLKGAMREGAAAFLHELRRDKENEQADEGKRVA